MAALQINPNAPLYRRAVACIPEIARRMVAAYAKEVPFYASLPRELLEGEITDITVTHLQLSYATLREGMPARQEEMTEAVASVVRRAYERFPLHAMLEVCLLGAQIAWQGLIELAEPDETHDLLFAGLHIFRYLEANIPTIALTYIEEHQAIHGEERELRRSLVEALLAGARAELVAERAAVTLAPSYAVVVLRLSAPADLVSTEGVEVPGRRIVRHVQAELDAHAATRVLAVLDPNGGTALLPATAATLAGVLEALSGLADAIAARTRSAVVCGVAAAPDLAAIPAATREAGEVAHLAARLGRPTGVYRLEHMLLEYQMSRPGPARDRLLRLLDELAGQPHLLEALRTFIARGYNRKRAAADLFVHRNTLNYRLQRVAAITGFDPGDPDSARVLAAALMTRDLLGER